MGSMVAITSESFTSEGGRGDNLKKVEEPIFRPFTLMRLRVSDRTKQSTACANADGSATL